VEKLTEAAFSMREAVRGWMTLYSCVVGFCIEERAVHPGPGERDERYDVARRAQRIGRGRYPLALAAGEELFGAFDERFEHGLHLIVAGLDQRRRA
jgi:TetR/AcrR family tetracycline transcriptional repressor